MTPRTFVDRRLTGWRRPSAGSQLPVATPSRSGFVALRAVGRYTGSSGERMRRLRRNAGANAKSLAEEAR
ncbi:MAG TPA: hypothetical protein VGJ78_13000, partial [Vicinamibacterales bacterium]